MQLYSLLQLPLTDSLPLPLALGNAPFIGIECIITIRQTWIRCVCVVLFLQTVIVTLLVQSMIAVMTEDFVSVRRGHQGLNVINVCRDISGTAWAVNVSNSESRPSPATLLPLRLYATTCSYFRAENEQNALRAVRKPHCLNLSGDSHPGLCHPFLSTGFWYPLFLLQRPGGAPTDTCKSACLASCELSSVYQNLSIWTPSFESLLKDKSWFLCMLTFFFFFCTKFQLIE